MSWLSARTHFHTLHSMGLFRVKSVPQFHCRNIWRHASHLTNYVTNAVQSSCFFVVVDLCSSHYNRSHLIMVVLSLCSPSPRTLRHLHSASPLQSRHTTQLIQPWRHAPVALLSRVAATIWHRTPNVTMDIFHPCRGPLLAQCCRVSLSVILI